MGSILNFVSLDNSFNNHSFFPNTDDVLKENLVSRTIKFKKDDFGLDGPFKNFSYTLDGQLSNENNLIYFEYESLLDFYKNNFSTLKKILDYTSIYDEYFKNKKLKILFSCFFEASDISFENFKNDIIEVLTQYDRKFTDLIFVDCNFNYIEKYSNYFYFDLFKKLIPNLNEKNIKENDLGYISEFPNTNEIDNYLDKKYHFLCFNNSPRIQRIYLLFYLKTKKLLDKFNFSFLQNIPNSIIFPEKNFLNLSTEKINELNKIIPLEIDTDVKKRGFDFYPVDTYDKNIYYNSYFHICTETCFLEKNITYFTEKIHKPLIGLQPFIVISTPFYLENLKKMGFKTFDKIFDESYDKIIDNEKRLIKIFDLIDEVCTWDLETCKKKYKSVLDICIYNHNHIKNLHINFPFLEVNLFQDINEKFKNI